MSEVTVDIMRLPHGAGLPLPSYQSAAASGLDLVLVLRPGVLQAGHDALLRDLGLMSGALRLAARR